MLKIFVSIIIPILFCQLYAINVSIQTDIADIHDMGTGVTNRLYFV